MSPLGRGKTSELIQFAKNYRQSAVAIILSPEQEDVSIILTERMAYDGPHSAQISFPGGRFEDFDFDFSQTAIRETREEIGIELNTNHLLGKLSNVYVPVSRFLIHPYVFYLDKKPIFTNNYEVKETFFIFKSQLINPSNVSTMDVQINQQTTINVPCFNFNDKKVWGATALILNELKSILTRIQ
jgi:8-oxo-dGTP pyrophosphatase MutT (NUDIX family)